MFTWPRSTDLLPANSKLHSGPDAENNSGSTCHLESLAVSPLMIYFPLNTVTTVTIPHPLDSVYWYSPLRSLLQLGPVFSLWPAFFPIPPARVARIPELSHDILVISWAKPYWSYLEAWLVHFRSKGTVWFIFRACGSNPWNAPVLKNGWPDCKTQ